MNKYLLLICLVLQTLFFQKDSKAQEKTHKITGLVVDAETQKPGEYFTIALKNETAVIKSVVTNEQGKFSIAAVKGGKYTLIIGSLGYLAKQLPLDLVADIDLGKVTLSPQGNNLAEVAVVGSKPIIKQEPDRITYDAQADPESKVLSVLDMMRKVPLLSVDADDNIKMKGSGNYKILINGKPSGVIARDPKEFLKNMPAANVQKIEVITTPPSKYESEGLSGIINIVTAKKVTNGYNGGVNVRVQQPTSPGISGNFTMQQGNFGLNAYAGTGIYRVGGVKMWDVRNSKGTLTESRLTSSGFQNVRNRWGWAGGELSYEIDSLNLITAEVNPYAGYNKQNTKQHFELVDGTNTASYDMQSPNRYDWGGTNYSVNYQRGFKNKKEHLLTLSYSYFDSQEPQYSNVLFSNAVNYNGTSYKQENNNNASEQTIQIDYVNPFKKVTVEAGIKTIARNGDANFNYLTFNPTLQDYVLDPTQGNAYTNKQNIYGAYNTYILKLKDWTFKAGARLEGTYVEGNFASTNSAVKTNYFNLVPSISLNRTLKSSKSVSFGYTQRIERPGIYDLNPFVDKSSPNFEVSGNPDLEAVLSNNFELTFSSFKKGSLNLSLSYNFANNTQQTVYSFSEVDQVTRITYLNVGKDRLFGTNANFNYPLTKKWNLAASANLNYIWLEGMINGALVKNDGVTGFASLNTSYKFEKAWRASLSFNYNAPSVMLQGSSSNYYYFSAGGSKDIIKDKLTISATVANPFQKFRAYRSFTEGANFTQERVRENYYRRMFASLSWKFGKLQGSIKKSERSINNNDTKAKSNN